MTFSDWMIEHNPELAALVGQAVPASKYKNTKAEADGMTFQSGHEAAGVAKLILLEKQHQIYGLRLQVRFPLPGGNTYVADATFLDNVDGQLKPRVIDFKGVRTHEYRVKAKAFKAEYGMEIQEW